MLNVFKTVTTVQQIANTDYWKINAIFTSTFQAQCRTDQSFADIQSYPLLSRMSFILTIIDVWFLFRLVELYWLLILYLSVISPDCKTSLKIGSHKLWADAFFTTISLGSVLDMNISKFSSMVTSKSFSRCKAFWSLGGACIRSAKAFRMVWIISTSRYTKIIIKRTVGLSLRCCTSDQTTFSSLKTYTPWWQPQYQRSSKCLH